MKPMDIERMRALARKLFDAGVAAADPFRAVSTALRAAPAQSGATLIAVGKAAVRMTEAALESGLEPREAIVVTNPENARDILGARVFAASHPVPDAVGLAAADAVEAALRREERHVLTLISGGGSALLPAPAPGLTLSDKVAVNELLLASGADIVEMNLVRQNLSRLKGGGIVRAAFPARVRALILSDVVGDDLRAIASGPTVSPLGSRSQARTLCGRYGIWETMPPSVQAHLNQDVSEEAAPQADNELIGSNTVSMMAMAAAAEGVGMNVHLHAPALTGDVEEAARRVATTTDPGIHLFGGETTVQLTGHGRGGRNQELALRAALHLGGGDWVYLQGGTDGRDGPTDAAGGFLDPARLARIKATVDVSALLNNNDAYRILSAGDGLLMTGATGTNVADLGVLIRG